MKTPQTHPTITIFCAFTRLNMVDRWLDDLDKLDVNEEFTSLAFIVDGADKDQEDPEVEARAIYQKLHDYCTAHNYRKWLITRNEEHGVNMVNIGKRRARIAEVKNQSKQLIANMDSEYILSLEDDTTFDRVSVQRLLAPFDMSDNVGFVSAYEAGRWFQKMIGIWEFDNQFDPEECWTCLPRTGLEQIDAAGFYCYLTPTDLYMAHDYNWQGHQPWGPDVNYGLWLRFERYDNYVDWTQPCGHNIDPDGIIEPYGNLAVEHFIKNSEGEWHRVKPRGSNV